MANIFIFHGYGASPNDNWFQWLAHELEAAGHVVLVPEFPNSDKPVLKDWLKMFKTYKETIDESTVLIGHSLGGAFAMRYLEQTKMPVQATFLVASVFGVMGNEMDQHITTFNAEPFDHAAIVANAGDLHIVHSDNDPYIPLPQAEDAALGMMVAMDLIPGGEHFCTKEFEQLRDMILATVI